MADSPQDLRTCPTRVDGAAVLIAHKVTSATCLERQRGGYHKCFTCAYNHAYVAQHGLPVEPAAAASPLRPAAEEPAPQPVPAERPPTPALERAARVG